MFAYFVGTLDDCETAFMSLLHLSLSLKTCLGFRYGGFSCTVLLLFAGFLIPPIDMSPAFGWLHSINPMYYGFENVSGLIDTCIPLGILHEITIIAAFRERVHWADPILRG